MGATLEQVAFVASMDASNLSRIERGIQQPSWALLQRIASALNLSVVQLYETTDDSTASSPSQEHDQLTHGKEAQKMLRQFQQLNEHHRRLALKFMKLLARHQKFEV